MRRPAVIFAALACLATGLGARADVVTAPTHRVSAIAPPAADVNGSSALHTGGARNVTADGKTIVFHSNATNLVAGGGQASIYTWSRVTGAFTKIATGIGGAQPDGPSLWPSIADDGRVVFESWASNLVAGDTNGKRDVFARDPSGTISRVSLSSTGSQLSEPFASTSKSSSSISPDGRFVVFESQAAGVTPVATNGRQHIFLRDTCYKASPCTPTTTLVSVASDGSAGNGNSSTPTVSSGGRFVAFSSSSSNLVVDPGGCLPSDQQKILCDTNGSSDIYMRDTVAGLTHRVSWPSLPPGPQPSGDSLNPQISSDGRYVVFESVANFLEPGDQNSTSDVFVRDVVASTTTRVSGKATGEPVAAHWGSISSNGAFVAYSAGQGNAGNSAQYVYVWDRSRAQSTRVPAEPVLGYKSTYGLSPLTPLPPFATGIYPSLAGNGSALAFVSDDPRIDPLDLNGFADVFLRQFQCAGGTCVIA